jgi:hypothetical protein
MKDRNKDVATFMLNSLKEKSFRDKLGLLNTDVKIIPLGNSTFRLLIVTDYPYVGLFYHNDDNNVNEFLNSDDLKFLIEIQSEIRWLLLKQSAKTFFKFCLCLIATLILSNTLF